MSDPVSNREIEDVLSSIRRLVSIENRGERKDSAPANARSADVAMDVPSDHPTKSAEDAKLVLTPSFRVKDSVDAAEEGADHEPDHPVSAESGDDSLSLEQWQVEPEREPLQQAEPDQALQDGATESDETYLAEAEAEDGHNEHQSSEDEAGYPPDDQDLTGESVSDAIEDDAPAEHEGEPALETAKAHDNADPELLKPAGPGQNDIDDQTPDDHDTVAEPEDVGQEESEEKSSDAQDEPEPDQVALAEAFAEADFSLPDDTAVTDEDIGDDAAPEDGEGESRSADRELEARIAEVEAAVAARQDTWEPEAEDADDYAARKGNPLPWDDLTDFEDASNEGADVEEPEPEKAADMDGSVDEGLTEAAPVMPEPDPETADDGATKEKDKEMAGTPQQAAPVANVSAEAAMLAAMRANRSKALALRVETTPERPVPEPEEPVETHDIVWRRTRVDQEEEKQPCESAEDQSERDANHEHDANHEQEQNSETENSEPEPEVETAATSRAEWYSDDAVMDEDALRDLVADIVRQELQGALGERITRNVRKLVRREIHRAMMGQEFD